MPLICVWTADCQSPDDIAPAVRANSQRCLVHTDLISYAIEQTLASTEVYVTAYLTNGTVVNIFEQTLDSILLLSKPEAKPNA